MPAVVEELAVRVLVAEQLLGGGEQVGGRRLTSARHLADHLDPPGELHAVQLTEVVAAVDEDRHPRVAGEVRPALAPDDAVQPQRRAVPDEPQRRRVRRAVGADRRDPAGTRVAQERVDLLGGHRDPLAAPLLTRRALEAHPAVVPSSSQLAGPHPPDRTAWTTPDT